MAQSSHGADLGCVNGGGMPRLPWLHVPPPKVRVEVLNAVLANGGSGEVREGHGQRNVGTVMHPVRRAGRYVHRPPWRQGVRGDLRRQSLDPPVGAVPVPVDLVPPNCVALEAPDADGLAPTDLHQQAVLDVEVDRRDRIRGGNKDECHPFAHLALCLAIIPDSSWSRWVFMSSAMPGSSSTLSRVSQAFALCKSRMTSPGRSRAPRGGPP